ncbi:hypothetical protein BJ508DRAFT_327554 [Ascobolus immersus RN42]|uniref:Uncharacterized protein n=1 Tax=Ascobolus immersus RN42 TaxID=1160509 RepID=A0A3N4I466_ASCIM|nr:hypothetical protein BJ508DRAFT_327554 [Ascobolus immersus RN42]
MPTNEVQEGGKADKRGSVKVRKLGAMSSEDADNEVHEGEEADNNVQDADKRGPGSRYEVQEGEEADKRSLVKYRLGKPTNKIQSRWGEPTNEVRGRKARKPTTRSGMPTNEFQEDEGADKRSLVKVRKLRAMSSEGEEVESDVQ